MTETFYATQQVRDLTGQGWPPAGIECCAVRGRPRLRSVHRAGAGRVIEPRKHTPLAAVTFTVSDSDTAGRLTWSRSRRGRRGTAMPEIAIGGQVPTLEAMGTAADPSSSRGNRDSSTGERERRPRGRLRNGRPVRRAPVAVERMPSKRERFGLH